MTPYEKRKKLDDKTVKMIFLEYDDQAQGYRIADIQNRNVIATLNRVGFLASFPKREMEICDDISKLDTNVWLLPTKEIHENEDELNDEDPLEFFLCE